MISYHARKNGDLLIWTIYERPIDYPDVYVARPFSGRTEKPYHCHLEAPTIREIREILPKGLTRIPREAGDDPNIVETWI